MKRLLFTGLVAIAAISATPGCSGGKGKSDPANPGGGTGSGDGVLAKKITVSWGFQAVENEPEMTDVFLSTTDEVGKSISHELGRYKGKCEIITPAAEMNALTGASCIAGGGGTELHAVKGTDEIVVVQMGVQPGAKPDPMSRQQVKAVKIPIGFAVEAATK